MPHFLKITEDAQIAAEDGFRVLSVKTESTVGRADITEVSVKILTIGELRIGLVTSRFSLDD